MKTPITLFLLLFSSLTLQAQEGLHVEDVFDGDIVQKTYMIENLIKGQQLSSYKLSFFRSIKFKATAQERRKIEERVEEDMKNAVGVELERQVDKTKSVSGTLSYAMLTLAPDKQDKASHQHRFLCYQCSPIGNDYAITLVFMRGKASLEELKKVFKK